MMQIARIAPALLALLCPLLASAGDVFVLRTHPAKPDREDPIILTIDIERAPVAQAAVTLTLSDRSQRRIARFTDYRLLSRARCLDCNQDVFGIAAADDYPTAFDALRIEFDGRRSDGVEAGTVQIGATVFYYERARLKSVGRRPIQVRRVR
jgi:hypothetical protein